MGVETVQKILGLLDGIQTNIITTAEKGIYNLADPLIDLLMLLAVIGIATTWEMYYRIFDSQLEQNSRYYLRDRGDAWNVCVRWLRNGCDINVCHYRSWKYIQVYVESLGEYFDQYRYHFAISALYCVPFGRYVCLLQDCLYPVHDYRTILDCRRAICLLAAVCHDTMDKKHCRQTDRDPPRLYGKGHGGNIHDWPAERSNQYRFYYRRS